MAYWVHVPDMTGAWVPPPPVGIPRKGFPALHVEAGEHEIVFSSPAQLAHCIEVLSTRPVPTSRQLSLKRGTNAGPNGHWLSRLPAALKSPRRREELVEQTLGGTSTSVTFGYNANGDLTSDGLHTFSYDAEGRLTSVTTGATDASPTVRYAHNALGQRVFKSEPLYPPSEGDENDAGFMASLIAFFKSLWAPATNPAEGPGFVYAYDEDGSLLGELGLGGASSSDQWTYMWLPTANGPLPVAMLNTTTRYAIFADNLHTPRRLTMWDGQISWQWAYSAFGDAQPTVAARKFADVPPVPGDLEFHLRYPGQTEDKESGLFYNYFRSYSPTSGRYSQPDPIGLNGGWNRFGYVRSSPLSKIDPWGLRPLTAQERTLLGPYIPEADLDSADVHVGEMPWYAPDWAAGITRGNDIYFRSPQQTFCTPEDLGLLGHELVHVGQYREGMTWMDYFWASRGGYDNNKYELPAYELQRKIQSELHSKDCSCKN